MRLDNDPLLRFPETSILLDDNLQPCKYHLNLNKTIMQDLPHATL